MPITADVYLEFIENHLPGLKAGKYRFSGKQTLAGAGIGDGDSFVLDLPAFQAKVAGERFTINPAEILTVFPPKNSLGHYATVLPHIAFKRDTLPWERLIAKSDKAELALRLDKTPWMALLVLNEDEILTDQGVAPASVEEYQQAEDGYVKTGNSLATGPVTGDNWPPHLDDDDNRDERFKVIYVRKESLQKLLADDKALAWLAHARRSRLRLTGVQANQLIKVYDDKHELIHQEVATAADCRIDCGLLAAGSYTIEVDGVAIADQPLQLKPDDQVGGETALVVANRLPQQGVKSVIHLVSLEDRYQENDNGVFTFDFGGYDKAVPLVSLYSWSFTALTEKETFRHILLHLNHAFLFGVDTESLTADLDIVSLRSAFSAGRNPLGDQAAIVDRAIKELSDKDQRYYVGQTRAIYNAAGRKIAAGDGQVPANVEEAIARIPNHRLHSKTVTFNDSKTRQVWINDNNKQYFVSEVPSAKRLLVYLLPGDDTPSLRLPSREGSEPGAAIANSYLQQGYVPMPHHFRRGGKSVSWYRSPLLAGKPGRQISDEQFPVHTADELLRYDTANGLFDVSYAAAWELGRLLCLNNKRASLELYRWKRLHVRSLKTMEQRHLYPHLPLRSNVAGEIVLPEIVENWLADISLLKGLPFSYLVPDARMLPGESLRFFYLDPSWIASLIDGALSIGRVNKGHDTAVSKQALADTGVFDSAQVISGFLLRSSVVKGWPDLQVNAYNSGPDVDAAGNSELACLRLERLSDNVLLGLFQGEMNVLDIHETPHTIHSGFYLDETEDNAIRIIKYPLQADGQESDVCLNLTGDNPLMDEGTRVIQPDGLAERLQTMDLRYTSFTSAQLALSLIEGVCRVRFTKNGG